MTILDLVRSALAALLIIPAAASANLSFSTLFPKVDPTATLTIAPGEDVLLDRCDLTVARLTINGVLRIDDHSLSGCERASLRIDSLVISGPQARLLAGTPEQPLTTPLTITLTGEITPNMGMVEPRQIMVMRGGTIELYGASGWKRSWTSLAATARAGEQDIAVADPEGWEPGDQLVIASSNLDPREAEVVTIAAVAGTQLRLESPLAFDHYGELQQFAGKTIDTRAEVGLLSHTIVIEGDASSTTTGLGGNIMIMNEAMERPESSRQTLLRPPYTGDASVAILTGVELRSMGQRGRPGRYPLHWHLVDSGYASRVSNSSIHHGFQRAVNLHGTDGVTVEGVVAYHIPNHMFVPSEDGDEAHNRFIANLGVLSLPVDPADFGFPDSRNASRSAQSEERNAVFWLRSSFNELRGNHAAGAWRGQGFFLDHGGMNQRSIKYAQAAAGAEEICQFEDNLAHSIYVGLGSPDLYTPFVRGFGLFTTSHKRRYARNPDRYTHCTLRGFRAYKTQNGGTWSEDGTTVVDLLVTDSHMGTVAGDVVRDAVVVGQTDNRLNAGREMRGPNPDRSRGGFAQSNNGGQRVRGRVFEDVTCINLPTCFFAQTNRDGEVGQLEGARIDAVYLQQTPQGFSVGGAPVRFANDVQFGGFVDVDGALTGVPGYTGTMDSPVFVTPKIPYRNRWGWDWIDTPAN